MNAMMNNEVAGPVWVETEVEFCLEWVPPSVGRTGWRAVLQGHCHHQTGHYVVRLSHESQTFVRDGDFWWCRFDVTDTKFQCRAGRGVIAEILEFRRNSFDPIPVEEAAALLTLG